MSINRMRELVAAAYPGPGWKSKVKNMPDDQIIAVYRRLVVSGKIK